MMGHGVIITVSDSINRLDAKAKEIREVVNGRVRSFKENHALCVMDLETQAERHFAIRVVLLPEYAEAQLPPMKEICGRIEEMTRT
jgi:hypothetical protein